MPSYKYENLQRYCFSTLFDECNAIEKSAYILSVVLVIVCFPFSLFFCFKRLEEYERVVIFRLGRISYGVEQGPGIVFTMPCIDKYFKFDIRTTSFNLQLQEIRTIDSNVTNVEANVFYRIKDPIRTILNISDATNTMKSLTKTKLIKTIGAHKLSDWSAEKDKMVNQIQEELNSVVDKWGITIKWLEINVNSYSPHDDPSYKKCQELKMERWIQMHYQIKEREQAMEIARKRELFLWLGGFYITSVFGCFLYYQRIKKSPLLLPIIPMTFIMGYYYDMTYGSKPHRIQAEANMIMEHESDLLTWPGGLPTVSSIDEARVEVEMEKRMHPHHS